MIIFSLVVGIQRGPMIWRIRPLFSYHDLMGIDGLPFSISGSVFSTIYETFILIFKVLDRPPTLRPLWYMCSSCMRVVSRDRKGFGLLQSSSVQDRCSERDFSDHPSPVLHKLSNIHTGSRYLRFLSSCRANRALRFFLDFPPGGYSQD